MTLTKEYRLVWDSVKVILYGQFSLDTQTETNKVNTFECDTRTELDNKVTSLGFEVPEDPDEPETGPPS